MRTLTRGRLWLLGLWVLSGLAVTAVAYACTPTANIRFDKPSYRAGENVEVYGREFEPRSARPAEVQFGPDGAAVGRAPIAADGTWTLSFALPSDIKPGTYLVYAPARDENDQIIKVARTPLTVTGPRAARRRTGEPGKDDASARPETPAPGSAGGAGRAAEAAGGRSGGRVFADSQPPAEPAASAAREAASADRALPPAGAARPSERSASGDLWSGFGFAGRASLVPGANDPAGPVRGTGAQLVVGISLLGAGVAVLLAGGAVTRSRSRRRRVASGGARRG